MKTTPVSGMQAATRLTIAGRLSEATAVLQKLLSRQPAATPPRGFEPAILARTTPVADTSNTGAATPGLERTRSSRDGRFVARTFTNKAGSRPYKLYVPSGYSGLPAALVVMLHGCTQSPDDFAAGTRMNAAAEAGGFLVAYPAQTSAANMHKCWNWFNPGDQGRDAGEPSLIAGITREVMAAYAIDPRRVYVAGLSAGGAAAAIMGEAYPDLYAAVGVHSGLACGAARDMASGLAAMQRGGHRGAPSKSQEPAPPTIIFHGERDTTVNPVNGEAVSARAARGAHLDMTIETGRVPGGHAFTRTLHTDSKGDVVVERWVVHGAGHAWSGGAGAASYTDPRGPDATAQMVRFFLAHPHPSANAAPAGKDELGSWRTRST